MTAMTTSEMIDWIQGDASKVFEERGKLPKLVYVMASGDVRAWRVERTGDGEVTDWIELATPVGYVEVRPDQYKPRGTTPVRCYRCPCSKLFLDDSARTGECVSCMMERIARQVHACGDIPVIADPTLKPGEFRIEAEPMDAVESPPPKAPWRGGYILEPKPIAGAFHIDPDPPDLIERERDRIAHLQRDEAMAAGWTGDNWSWCGGCTLTGTPFSSGRCPKATCVNHRLHAVGHRLVVKDIKVTSQPPYWEQWSTSTTFAATPVEASARIEFKPRPDGFDQSRIDAIKAQMTATVGRRK